MTHYFVFKRWRPQWVTAALLACSIFCWCALANVVHGAGRLVTQEEARHLGLERAWFAQIRLDRARNRVEGAVLKGDRLTVLTSAGVVQELNAVTGETLWIAPLGNPNHPSLGPAASDEFIALINGSNLFVLDRADGRPVIVRPVGGAPGAAPALGKKYVFVPLVSGRVEGYPLGEQKLTPWYYQSIGRAMVAPLTTPESIVWATDSGHLYVGRSEELGVRFRLETMSEIIAKPAYHAPFVYAATASGEVFALDETTAARRWKYATGFLVTRAPAAVEERVFVTSDEPVLHCIDAERGIGLWEARSVSQFAAVSRKRVYGVDDLGALVVLDAATGALLARMPADQSTHALVNDQTDRVYLISSDGMVQCLHERGAEKPIYYQPKIEAAPPAESAEGQPPAATQPPLPPQTEEEAGAPPDEPVTEEAEMPADESDVSAEENPFDFEAE
jgi:outer membrane protein assembly factor BamB